MLAAAEDGGFDLFLIVDQELSYQQNLMSRKMAVLVLSTNNWSLIKEQVAAITAAIDAATPGRLALVVWTPGSGPFGPRALDRVACV